MSTDNELKDIVELLPPQDEERLLAIIKTRLPASDDWEQDFEKWWREPQTESLLVASLVDRRVIAKVAYRAGVVALWKHIGGVIDQYCEADESEVKG
jgi:hypothetical protein